MSGRADAALAAIVARLADAGHGAGAASFRACEVAPVRDPDTGVRVAARTVALLLRRAGWADWSVEAGGMVLTPAGLRALDAARRAVESARARVAPRASDAPASPCVGTCGLDDAGLCRGCGRTAGEIAGWRDMPDAEKRGVLADLPRRGAGSDETGRGA